MKFIIIMRFPSFFPLHLLASLQYLVSLGNLHGLKLDSCVHFSRLQKSSENGKPFHSQEWFMVVSPWMVHLVKGQPTEQLLCSPHTAAKKGNNNCDIQAYYCLCVNHWEIMPFLTCITRREVLSITMLKTKCPRYVVTFTGSTTLFSH